MPGTRVDLERAIAGLPEKANPLTIRFVPDEMYGTQDTDEE